MQSSITPSGDSLSISASAQPAPRRRGRPRKHFASVGCTAASARKAAYRARLRLKRAHNKKLELQRDISGLLKVQGGLRRRVYPDGFVSVFTVPTAEEQKLLNTTLAGLGYGMSKGEFVRDAPKGAGRLISGGFDGEKLSFIRAKQTEDAIELADGRFAPLKCGRHIKPGGWGSNKDEKTGSIGSQFEKALKNTPKDETDFTFIDKKLRDVDESSLTCYVNGCQGKVWGIRVVRGKEKYHCDLHAPVAKAA